MPPDSTSDSLAGKAMDAMSDGISAKSQLWIRLTQTLGFPIIALSAIGYVSYQGVTVAYTDIVKPVAESHIKTLDKLTENSTQMTGAIQELTRDKKEDSRKLDAVIQEQRLTREVLMQGLQLKEKDK